MTHICPRCCGRFKGQHICVPTNEWDELETQLAEHIIISQHLATACDRYREALETIKSRFESVKDDELYAMRGWIYMVTRIALKSDGAEESP